jgi:hypothetical protein
VKSRGTIVVGGALAQRPGIGGHTWVILQYVLGLRRLGWDVLLLDRLSQSACVDETGTVAAPEQSINIRYAAEVIRRFGLEGHYALDYDNGQYSIALTRTAVLARVRQSVLFINIMGFITDAEILSRARTRLFLDIDPGYGQMWRALGLADIFHNHDLFATVGQRIGESACPIPSCGLEWIPTPPPVVLDQWPATEVPERLSFTSINSWRGSYGPVHYGGVVYGLRVHQFRSYVDMPRRTGQRFELALNIHPGDARDLASLHQHEWSIVDPRVVAGDPWSYRSYIQRSSAEFMVAAGMPVQTASGWLSDRTACYLATGRPVVAQDTGLGGLVPTGKGLLTFASPDEAADRIESVCRDYRQHARAARRIAEDVFDSDKVLGRLLARSGVA